MQLMSAHAFDPLKAARAFKDAGADEQLAEAVAGAIGDAADAVEKNLATKADLDAFKHVTKSALEALRSNSDGCVSAMDRALDALEQRMKTALYRTLWLQTGVIIAAVTAVTKLLP